MLTEKFLLGRHREAMSANELAVLEDAVASTRNFPARHPLVRAGEPVDSSMMLLDGFICRYMDDREGHRQLVSIHVPGDFVDLHGFPMKRLDHDVATLGPARVAIFEHRALAEIMVRHPHLTRMLWFSTLLDAAMHREWIFRMGRLGAEGRVAHLMCELGTRLAMVGLAGEDRFALPLIQADIAEACGITGVHVNRVLRMLREQNLMIFRSGEVAFLDRRRLAALAEFDPQYLYGSNPSWLRPAEPRKDS